MSILEAIAARHGTDKAKHGHNYCVFYERFLQSLRDEPISIMEIGVGNGDSLRLWRDYFQNAKIVGLDIENNALTHQEDRIAIEIGDQGNLDDLLRCGERHGPFDLILDDGSHNPEHQIFSLTTLIEFVKQSRYYIMEDVVDETVISFLNQITRSVMKNTQESWARIETISFYEQTTVLRKKP